MQAIEIRINRINAIYKSPWIHATKHSVLTLFREFKTTWIYYWERRTWCKIMFSDALFHNLHSLVLILDLFNCFNNIKKLNGQIFCFLNNIFFVFHKFLSFKWISFSNNWNYIRIFRYLPQTIKFFIFGTMTIEKK